jgi:Zn-dependent metalloprotease
MKTRHRSVLLAAAVLACAGAPSALAQHDARQGLRDAAPGVRFHQEEGRTRIVYGKPMNAAASPREAAQRWLAEHGRVFVGQRLDLDEVAEADVGMGRFMVYHYEQTIDGLPVDSSPGRVLVRDNGDGTWSVVYAAGLFAPPPRAGFAPMTLTGRGAVEFVRGTEFGRLLAWSEPELVVYQLATEGGVEARRAWRFVGENPDLLRREKFTFFVDAATGAMLEARNEVHHADVFGFVRGNATPGLLPDMASNPPVLFPVNDVRVAISGGNNAFTDTDGFFNISHGGNNNVTITSSLTNGRWSRIVDQSGTAVQSVSGTATPGQEAELVYNTSPAQFTTAQVNAFIHTGLIHNFVTDRTSWTGMNFVCTTNVNINSSCNAYFDGSSINFFRAAGGCNNTAYSTVVAHEYGHYIVFRLGLSQGAFGEGFADVCAQMLYDTGIVGEHFFTNGGFIRDNENTNRSYPCSGGVHFCGQLLAGGWHDVRENFGATYGSEAGLTVAQQLFVDWMLITSGGQGDNSAHPGTIIEILTVDDNDGDLDNGTPNYNEICDAWGPRNLACPPLVPLEFTYPDGLPDEAAPDGSTAFRVVITGANGFTPQPGTGVLHVDAGGGFDQYPMDQITDNVYLAEFPGYECGTELRFYLSARATSGVQGRDPTDAPADAHRAVAAVSYTELANDDFETDTGWTVVDEGFTRGSWERGVPAVRGGTAPEEDFDGSGQCYLTGNFLSNSDVDGGPTRLISPEYDIAGLSSPTVSFARWFYNQDVADDFLEIEVSGDGGSTWVLVEAISHTGKVWIEDSFAVRDFLPDADSVVVRFSVEDRPNNSETEAAIDAFRLADLVCDDGCIADFNGDGVVDTQDVLAFLNAWVAGDDSADVNGDGEVNTQDVLEFLNLWNAGC